MSDISREDYPSNAKNEGGRQSKPKVIRGKVVERKKPLGRKIAEMFAPEDIGGVGDFVITDVILPGIKNTIFNAAIEGLQRVFFGDVAPRVRGTGVSQGSTVNYGAYYRPSSVASTPSSPSYRNEPERNMSNKARANHDFNEIVLETKSESEMVLTQLGDLIDVYGQASVADLYDMLGISHNYTDEKWGWTDISTSVARRIREGYLLDLPRPEQIRIN